MYNTYPDAVHGADFGSHRDDEHAIEAERTTSALVEFRCQSTHEAWETEVRIQAYTYAHTYIRTVIYIRQLASCLIYARTLLEYVIFILWLRSVSKMLPSTKFAEDKVLTFLILRENC